MRCRRGTGLPLPAAARGYRRSWLRGDLLAGVTVAAYLVPQVMAYARVAGLSPAAGLWAAAPALVIYAALGSSRSLSLGPEATTALMTAIAIGPLAAGNPARYASLAATLALLAGAMAIAAGLARLGFLADLLSRPVLVGYLTGVALIMIAGQLGTATGVPVTGEEFLPQVASFAMHAGDARLATSLITVAVLAFLFAMRARWPHAPGPLLAVLLATAAVAGFGLQRHGVQEATTGPPPALTPSGGYEPKSRRDNHNRTVPVVDRVGADRAQEEPLEAAPAAGTDDDHVGVRRHLQQFLGGDTEDGLDRDRRRTRVVGDLIEHFLRLRQRGLTCELREVIIARVNDRGAEEADDSLLHGHHGKRGFPDAGLAHRPLQRLVGACGAIDADKDPWHFHHLFPMYACISSSDASRHRHRGSEAKDLASRDHLPLGWHAVQPPTSYRSG